MIKLEFFHSNAWAWGGIWPLCGRQKIYSISIPSSLSQRNCGKREELRDRERGEMERDAWLSFLRSSEFGKWPFLMLAQSLCRRHPLANQQLPRALHV